MQSLNCNTLEYQNQKADNIIQHTMTEITILKGRKENTVKKYWTKTRIKTRRAHSKGDISISDVRALFRSPTPFILVDYDILLSPGLFLFSGSCFSAQISHAFGISNLLWSPGESRLCLNSFTQCPLWSSMQECSGHKPGFKGFPQLQGVSTTSFFCPRPDS